MVEKAPRLSITDRHRFQCVGLEHDSAVLAKHFENFDAGQLGELGGSHLAW